MTREDSGSPSGTHRFLKTCLFATIHAVLFSLAFPPFDLWPAAFVALVPLAWLAITAPSTSVALTGVMVTQLLMWLWLLRWLVQVTVVGYPSLALYLSLYAVLFVWITRRMCRHHIFRNWSMGILIPIIWCGVECLRGEVAFHGYPWYLLAHPVVSWLEFVQVADLLGSYFVSFLCAAVSGIIVSTFNSTFQRIVVKGTVIAVLILVCTGYGMWRMNQSQSIFPGPNILAIQTNLPQDNKIGWGVEDQARDVPEFIDFTREANRMTNSSADLIVWPETMVPGFGFERDTLEKVRRFPNGENLVRWAEAVESLSRELNTPLLVGSGAWVDTVIVEAEGTATLKPGATYNSAFLLQNDAQLQRYDKSFLTPFGETMPYISAWQWLEERLLSLGAPGMSFDLDSNPNIHRLNLNWSQHPIVIVTPICFEDSVSSLCRRMVYEDDHKRADILVNLSNDGWFGFSNADRNLHTLIARYRCIENRVPMIRCVNTGISSSIDSTGRVNDSLEAQDVGWLFAQIELDTRRTLYGRIGNVWPMMCLIFTVCGLIITVAVRPAVAKDERILHDE